MSEGHSRIEGDRKSSGAMTRPERCGFFALCLLGASAWLVEGAWPSAQPIAARQCLHDLAIASVAGIVGWRSSLRARRWATLALASVCLFGVPAMLVEIARVGVPDVTIAELFALLPVAVVVLVPHLNFARTGGSETGRLLAPALIGLAGMLLLLQFALPDSWRQARLEAVVVLAVVIAAVASVWMHRLLAGFTVAEAAVLCCLANAIFSFALLLASGWATGSGRVFAWAGDWSWHVLTVEMAKAILFDLPQIVLLLWLMREIAPTRIAARYLVIPLLTVLEGYALLRPEVTLSSIGGASLLVFGAWRLTTASERYEEPGLMLG